MRAVAGGLTLDAEACRVLFELAVRGAAVLRDRSGGGRVPDSTAALLEALNIAGGGRRGLATPGTGEVSAPVLAGESPTADAFTAPEAATRWGCTDSYVRRLCRTGAVPAVKDTEGGWSIPGEYVRQRTRPPRPEGSNDEQ